MLKRTLQPGHTISETRSSFTSSAVSAMYAYKNTLDDYRILARTIIDNYPFMKALYPGSPHSRSILDQGSFLLGING